MNTEVQAFIKELLAGQDPLDEARSLEITANRVDTDEEAGLLERLAKALREYAAI